jgi:hypothetical protein
MRYKAERRQDGYWICDTHKGELCFATRSFNQARAARWADTFNAAYMAFRDEAQLKPLRPGQLEDSAADHRAPSQLR